MDYKGCCQALLSFIPELTGHAHALSRLKPRIPAVLRRRDDPTWGSLELAEYLQTVAVEKSGFLFSFKLVGSRSRCRISKLLIVSALFSVAHCKKIQANSCQKLENFLPASFSSSTRGPFTGSNEIYLPGDNRRDGFKLRAGSVQFKPCDVQCLGLKQKAMASPPQK